MEDINEQAEWLNSIKINQLSNRALTLASKLSRAIRIENGHIIKLQDQKIAMRLAEQIADINKPELNNLYRLFLEEAIRVDDIQAPKEKPNKEKSAYRSI